jgi:hypothetical protein
VGFTDLYTKLGLVDGSGLNLGAFEFAGSTLSTTDSTAIVIDQATTITSNLSVGGDILPQTALGGDLGSSTLPWRSLYVSNNTIFIGGVPLGIDANGNLTVNGSQIAGGGGGSSLVNGAKTVSLDTDGNLTLPTQGKIMPVGDVNSFLTFNYGDDVELKAGDNLYLSGSVATIRTNGNANQWIFGTDGTLTAPGTITASNLIVDAGNISFLGNGSGIQGAMSFNLSTNNFTNNWNFSQDGTLSLPNNGSLTFPDGTTQTTAWTGFSVAADDSTQRLINADEVVKFIGAGGITTASDAEGNITITGSGGGIPLAGATYNLNATAGLAINTTDGGIDLLRNGVTGIGIRAEGLHIYAANSYILWDGSVLKFPSGSDIRRDDGLGNFVSVLGGGGAATGIESETDVSIRVNLTDSTQRIWRFGEDGDLTLPAGGDIKNSTGTSVLGGSVSSLVNGANTVSLESTGALTLPNGSTIGDADTFAGVPITTARGTILLGNSPEIGQYDHFHIMKAGQQALSLFLGDDSNYVKLPDTGGVEIATQNFNQYSWIFGTDGSLQIPGDIKSEGNINIDINLADSTLRRWQFGEDGDTVFPNNVSINYSGGNIQFPRIIADSGKAFSVQGQGTSGSAALSWTVDPDAAGQYAAVAVTKGGGDNLAKVILQAQSDSGDAGTVKLWKFDETGKLTLPTGGNISENGGLTGNAIKLTPAGGANANQALLIYPTAAAEGDHIHLTAGGGSTELYLGDDDHYVKLASNGFVVIKADDGVNGAVWGFSPDGTTSIPGDIKSDGNINIDINLSDSTLRRWSFGEDGDLTLPSGTITSVSGVSGLRLVNYDYAAELIWQNGNDFISGSTDVSSVKVDNQGVRISITQDGYDTEKLWTFNTGGRLLLPNNTTLKDTAGNAIAFGYEAGLNSQGAAAIAIGTEAGYTSQGANAVAVGAYAGGSEQGANSIAIGRQAGETAQAANSIILNATGATLDQTTANTFTVAPIRNISATSGVLQYNASTKEVSYSNSVTAETFNTDQITVVGNRISTTVTNANLELECNGTGSVIVNGGKLILNTGGNAYVESVDYGVNSANSALNIFGGPYQKINLRAGFGTQATLTLATDGTLTLPGSIVGTATQAVFNTTSTTVNAFGAATTALNIGASGAPITGFAATATTSSTASSLGYLGLPQSATATSATLAIGDAGKHIYVTTNSQTITIPANASVAYPIGTTLTFIAGPSATTVSIAITSDTLRLAGGTSTGTRTLAANGMATAVKVAATTWYINGTGLT